MKVNRIVVLIISLLIVGFLIYYFSEIVAYVLIAWVISMLGEPVMDLLLNRLGFRKYKMGHGLAAILTLVSFVLIFVVISWIFVPLIVQQARNLAGVDYHSIGAALEDPLLRINQWLYDFGLINEIRPAGEQLSDLLSAWFKPGQISNIFGTIVGLAGNIFIAIFSILFIAFFFLKEEKIFVNFLKAVVPTKYEDQVVKAIEDLSTLLTRYFGGILFQITIITLFVSVALGIFGIKNALLIGFFAAIINVIPYIGPMIGAAFGVFITISANLDLDFYSQMLPMLLTVIAVFAAMQLMDNFFLQPFIFSNSVKAHPLEIFIVILLGAKLGGILGMVLAIPGYTVMRVIAKVFLSEFKIVRKITGGLG